MYHQHNAEDHIELLADAKALHESINILYINYHNGDKVMNKRIMDARDKCIALIAELKAHSNNTRNVDQEWEDGQQAIRTLQMMQDKKEAFWNTAIGRVAGVVGTIIATLAAAYVINKIQ